MLQVPLIAFLRGQHCSNAYLHPLCRGVMRWEICFNLCILRMLSYALDLHQHRQIARALSVQHHAPRARTEHSRAEGEAPRSRQQATLSLVGDYGLLTFLAHMLYAPLYLAGPIITFHDFARQLRTAASPVGTKVSSCSAKAASCTG